MEFIDEQLALYVEAHSKAESELLKKINRDTHLKVLMPRMLSGHLQGQVLSILSCMIQPKTILEIGTYTGYSAICLAKGLKTAGTLITLDINAELEDRVRQYFEEAGLTKQIDYRIGNALEIIPSLDCSFDLVFIDADKNNYSNYYDLVIDKVNKGGYLIADNVLWSGKILLPEKEMDKDTLLIDAFNKKVQNDPRVENVLFPIRDGLMVMRKL
jgi:predicted O-methyltransferase YrrM